MYINCIFLEYYQAVISNMFVCIPVVMLKDNYMRRSMANKKQAVFLRLVKSMQSER